MVAKQLRNQTGPLEGLYGSEPPWETWESSPRKRDIGVWVQPQCKSFLEPEWRCGNNWDTVTMQSLYNIARLGILRASWIAGLAESVSSGFKWWPRFQIQGEVIVEDTWCRPLSPMDTHIHVPSTKQEQITHACENKWMNERTSHHIRYYWCSLVFRSLLFPGSGHSEEWKICLANQTWVKYMFLFGKSI